PPLRIPDAEPARNLPTPNHHHAAFRGRRTPRDERSATHRGVRVHRVAVSLPSRRRRRHRHRRNPLGRYRAHFRSNVGAIHQHRVRQGPNRHKKYLQRWLNPAIRSPRSWPDQFPPAPWSSPHSTRNGSSRAACKRSLTRLTYLTKSSSWTTAALTTPSV